VAEVTLTPLRAGVVGAFASAAALDAVQAPPGARTCRVAPDEIALVCAPGDTATVLDAVVSQIARGDRHGFALDLSDGWTGFSLTGDVREAFSYLSELRLPEPGSYAQGDVLRVPARVLRGEDRIDLLVPSPWGRYLHDELLEALRALDVREAGGEA
jgi:hypothetical protein